MQEKKSKKPASVKYTYIHDKSRDSPKHFLAEPYTMVCETEDNQNHRLERKHTWTDRQTDRYSMPAGRQYIVTESHNLRDLEKREGSYTQKGHNSVFITITKSPKSPKAPFQISIISDMTTHHLYELTSCDVISTSYQF